MMPPLWPMPLLCDHSSCPVSALYARSMPRGLGTKKWEVTFPEPPLASLLATGGSGKVTSHFFVPNPRGMLRAYNAETGQELWSHNNGIGHNGGIISYSAKGKQYIAVATGWGSLVGDEFGALFGEPYKSMPKDSGAIVVF